MLDGVDAEGLLVEVIQLSQFTLGTNDVGSAEQISWTRAYFTVNDVIIGLRIALNNNVSDAELLAFHHAHLDVDRIILDARLNGHGLEGEVAIVLVQ